MRTVLALSTIAIGIMLAGCSGEGGWNTSSGPPPFPGDYHGSDIFDNDNGGNENSSVDLSIAANGTVTGTYIVRTDSGNITGTVGRQGAITGTCSPKGTFQFLSTLNGLSTLSTGYGTLVFAQNGHLQCSISFPNGDGALDLTRQ